MKYEVLLCPVFIQYTGLEAYPSLCACVCVYVRLLVYACVLDDTL